MTHHVILMDAHARRDMPLLTVATVSLASLEQMMAAANVSYSCNNSVS